MQSVENTNFDRCKVYTSKPIANFMIDLLELDFSIDFKVLEPAVGQGNIFLEIIDIYLKYENNHERLIYNLENSFIAFDIDKTAIDILIYKLNCLIAKYNIQEKISWKIYYHDLLLSELPGINDITHIICNPPYIAYKNLTLIEKEQLRRFESAKKFTPNIYFAFIEYILRFKKLVKAVVISPSSFLKGNHGNGIREYIVNNSYLNAVYDFNNMVFDKQIMVCISVFSKKPSTYKYFRINSDLSNEQLIFEKDKPCSNNFVLSEPNVADNSTYIFKDIFDIKGAIATLDDGFFMIKEKEIINESNSYVDFIKKINGVQCNFKIEKKILKRLFRSKAHNSQKKYVIFPYQSGKRIELPVLRNQFPLYVEYYNKYNPSNQSLYFGRNQNIENDDTEKIHIPKMIKEFNFYIIYNEIVNSGISLTIKSEFYKNKESIMRILDLNKQMYFDRLTNQLLQHDSEYYSISTKALSNLQFARKDEIR